MDEAVTPPLDSIIPSPLSVGEKIDKGVRTMTRKYSMGQVMRSICCGTVYTVVSNDTGETFASREMMTFAVSHNVWEERNRSENPFVRSSHATGETALAAPAIAMQITNTLYNTGAAYTSFVPVVDTYETSSATDAIVSVILGRCGASLPLELSHYTNLVSGMDSEIDVLSAACDSTDVFRRVARRAFLSHKEDAQKLLFAGNLKTDAFTPDILYSIIFQVCFAIAVAEVNLGYALMSVDLNDIHILDAESVHGGLSKCAWAFRSPTYGGMSQWFVLEPEQHQGILVSLSAFSNAAIDIGHNISHAEDTLQNPSARRWYKPVGAYNDLVVFLVDQLATLVMHSSSIFWQIRCECSVNESDVAKAISIADVDEKQIGHHCVPPVAFRYAPVCIALSRIFSRRFAPQSGVRNTAILGCGDAVVTPNSCVICGRQQISGCAFVCAQRGTFVPALRMDPIAGRSPINMAAYPDVFSACQEIKDTVTCLTQSVPIPDTKQRLDFAYMIAKEPLEKPSNPHQPIITLITGPGNHDTHELNDEEMWKPALLISPDGMAVRQFALLNNMLLAKIITLTEQDIVSDHDDIIDNTYAAVLTEATVGHLIRKAILSPSLSSAFAATVDHAFYEDGKKRQFAIIQENVANGTLMDCISNNHTDHNSMILVEKNVETVTAYLANSEPVGRLTTMREVAACYAAYQMCKDEKERSSQHASACGCGCSIACSNYAHFLANIMYQVLHALHTGRRSLSLQHYDLHVSNVRLVCDASVATCDWAFRDDRGWTIIPHNVHCGLIAKIIDMGRAAADTMSILDAAGQRRRSVFVGADTKTISNACALPESSLYTICAPVRDGEMPHHYESYSDYKKRRYVWSTCACEIMEEPAMPNRGHSIAMFACSIMCSMSSNCAKNIDSSQQRLWNILCNMVDVDTAVPKMILLLAQLGGQKDNLFRTDIVDVAKLYGVELCTCIIKEYMHLLRDGNIVQFSMRRNLIFDTVTKRDQVSIQVPITMKIIRTIINAVDDWFQNQIIISDVNQLSKAAKRRHESLSLNPPKYIKELYNQRRLKHVVPFYDGTVPMDIEDKRYPHIDKPDVSQYASGFVDDAGDLKDFVQPFAYADIDEEDAAKHDIKLTKLCDDTRNCAEATCLQKYDLVSTSLYGPMSADKRRIAIMGLGCHPRANFASTLQCLTSDPWFSSTFDASKDDTRCLFCNWRLLPSRTSNEQMDRNLSDARVCSEFCRLALEETRLGRTSTLFVADPLSRFRTNNEASPLCKSPKPTTSTTRLSANGVQWIPATPEIFKHIPFPPTFDDIERRRKAQETQDCYIVKAACM